MSWLSPFGELGLATPIHNFRRAMPCYVYILGADSKSGRRTYVGWTTDLERRLQEHNSGTGARSTRGYHWSMLYAESYLSRNEAMSREWWLKRDRVLRKSIAYSLNISSKKLQSLIAKTAPSVQS